MAMEAIIRKLRARLQAKKEALIQESERANQMIKIDHLSTKSITIGPRTT